MKLVFSVLISFASLLIISLDVNADEWPKLPNVCNEEHEDYIYKDSDGVIMTGKTETTIPHSLRYDITYITVDSSDNLIIHGWVIDNAQDNDLGGYGTPDRTDDDTEVEFALVPVGSTNESEYIKFNTPVYANPYGADYGFQGQNEDGTGAPRWYNFTFWHCYRNSADASDYPNMCLSHDMPELYGGFKVQINLKQLYDVKVQKTYMVKMRWNHKKNGTTSETGGWREIGASSQVVSQAVRDFNDHNARITIDEQGNEVIFKSSDVRIIGSDGTFCTSVSEGTVNKTYYQQDATFYVEGKLISACRGGDNWCKKSKAGTVYLYPLKLDSTQIGNTYGKLGRRDISGAKADEKGTIAYATASWLEFKRKLKITVEGPEIIETECPDDVVPASCSESGTHAVFHEHKNLKTCTIERGNSSGFVAIDNDKTHDFCVMACKEDLDLYLPNKKTVKAGRYFVLDQNTPQITAKRTCVTTNIIYDNFLKAMDNAEKKLVDTYNRWQDRLHIKNKAVESPAVTENTYVCHCTGCEHSNDDDCDCSIQKTTDHTWTRHGVSDTPNQLEFLEERTETWKTGHDAEGADNRASTWTSDVIDPLNDAEKNYIDALNAYIALINGYNRCYNWLDKSVYTNDVEKSGDYNITTRRVNLYDDYKYRFQPAVSFDYEDIDGGVFPVRYSYVYKDSKDVSGFNEFNYPDTKINLWPRGEAVIDDEYSGGGTEFDIDKNYKLLNCATKTCSLTIHKNLSTSFYTNGYLKREELYDYRYHLPTIYTEIPSGRLTKNPNGLANTTIRLEQDAVPVNINTIGDTEYDYKITISGLKFPGDDDTDSKADIRYLEQGNNPDDNWDGRFLNKKKPVLNGESTEEYVCTYDVINDIYIPNKYNFFYRTVDMSNINPTGKRELGYNWTDERAAKVIENMKETDADYQKLTNSDRDKFEFTLTPTIMKAIRDYNSTRPNGYSDWTLSCKDYAGERDPDDASDLLGYHCYSNFLSCLVDSQSNGVCSYEMQDLKDALTTYSQISSYGGNALDKNRKILINKQNENDDRGN